MIEEGMMTICTWAAYALHSNWITDLVVWAVFGPTTALIQGLRMDHHSMKSISIEASKLIFIPKNVYSTKWLLHKMSMYEYSPTKCLLLKMYTTLSIYSTKCLFHKISLPQNVSSTNVPTTKCLFSKISTPQN